MDKKVTTLFLLGSTDREDNLLTPKYLANTIAPYLIAIENIQHAIDWFDQRPPQQIWIPLVSQNSPIKATFAGDINDSIKLILSLLVPWRREHEKKMARLEELKLQVEIDEAKTKQMMDQASAQKDRAIAKKTMAEADLLQEKFLQKKMELEKLQLEIYRAKQDVLYRAQEQAFPDEKFRASYKDTALADSGQFHEENFIAAIDYISTADLEFIPEGDKEEYLDNQQ
jgi:hypothetical protein